MYDRPDTASPKKNRSGFKAFTVFVVLIALLAGAFSQAQNEEKFEFAGKLRGAIGMPTIQTEPELEPEPQHSATAKPEISSPITTPDADGAVEGQVASSEERFVLKEMTWAEFIERPSMWPDSLSITTEQEIPVRYRGNNYGKMVFSPGQMIEVFELSQDGRMLGSIGENIVFIPAYATNLKEWFLGRHGKYEKLIMPETPEVPRLANRLSDEDEQQLLTELRIWVLKNYDTHAIQIEEDKLTLQWTPIEETDIDFRLEAREIARRYLMLGAAKGRDDNYASCEIVHASTGEFLGANGIFIPRL